MKRTLQKMVLCAGALLASFGLARVPEQEEVETVAAGITAKLQGILPDRTVESVEWVALEDDLGVWAVNLAPSGHLILGASTKHSALISFSEDDFTAPEAGTTPYALLLNSAQIVAEAEAGDGEEDGSWANSGIATAVDLASSAILYHPVDETTWSQWMTMGRFVPNGISGCAATAEAQVMHATRWPVYAEGFYESSLGCNAWDPSFSERYSFSPYTKIDYDAMPLAASEYASYDSKTYGNLQLARLVLLNDILSWMTFSNGSSGALAEWTPAHPWAMNYVKVGSAGTEAMKAAAAEGVPFLCSISSEGHVVLGSGYATSGGTDYISLNYGWGGEHTWYAVTHAGQYDIAYPKRTAQCDPLPAISSATPTLSWHIAKCYDDKVTDFTIEVAEITDDVTAKETWVVDYTDLPVDSAGHTGWIQVNEEKNQLNVVAPNWYVSPRAFYTWDKIVVPTETSTWTFDYQYASAHGPIHLQVLPSGGVWETVLEVNTGSWASSNGWLKGAIDLSKYAGVPCKFRLYAHPATYNRGTSGTVFSMKEMQVTNLAQIVEPTKTIKVDSASARSYTFTAGELTTGKRYAFTVIPNFSDDPAGTPSLPKVTRIADGENYTKEDFATFTVTSPSTQAASNSNMRITTAYKTGSTEHCSYRYCSYSGYSVIHVETTGNVSELEVYSSHPDSLPRAACTVVKQGNDVFDVVIDAAMMPASPRKNDDINLTLLAISEAGTRTSHELSLTFTTTTSLAVGETLPETIKLPETYTRTVSGTTTWTATDKWAYSDTTVDVPPENADVTLILSGNTTLTMGTDAPAINSLVVKGTGTLTLSGSLSVLKNFQTTVSITGGDLAVNFTEANPMLTFNNTATASFNTVTVTAAEGVNGQFAVSDGSVSITPTTFTTTVDVEVPVALANSVNAFEIPTGKVLKVTVPHYGILTRSADLVFDGTFAKVGVGTLTLNSNVNVTGGVEVREGTLRFGSGLIPYGADDLPYPTTQAGHVTVSTGATFDVGGRQNAYLNMVTLCEGATFANLSDTQVSNGARQLKGLTLTGDATVHANANFGILAGGYAATTLDLGGHVLTKTGGGQFWLAKTAVSNGTLKVEEGKFTSVDTAPTFSNVTFESDLDDAFSIGSGAITAPVAKKGSCALTLSGVISGEGTVTVEEGALTLTKTNTYTGETTIAADATLTVSSAANLGSGNVTVNGTLAGPVTIASGKTLIGSGTIDGALTLNTGAIIDATTLVSVTGEVTLPAALTLTGITAPTGNAEVKVLNKTFDAEAVLTATTITIGEASNYRLLQKTDGLYVKAITAIEGPLAVEMSANATSASLSDTKFDPASNTLTNNQLTITFTANDQTFIFDNTVDCAFETITVNGSFSGCKLVSAENAARVTATTTTLNTSIDATALNGSLGAVTMNGELTLKVGSADAVSSLSATGGTIEVCADVDYTQGGTDLLSLSAFANNTFKVGDDATVKLANRASSGSTADVNGNIIVGEGATLDLNGRLADTDTTVTLHNGATLTSSATVGSGYSWISWPFVNLQDENTTATISGATFSSVTSSNGDHTWNLNGGTLKFAMNTDATFKASSLNLANGTVEVTGGTLEFEKNAVTGTNTQLHLNGGAVTLATNYTFTSLAGSGAITVNSNKTLTLASNGVIDATNGLITVSGSLSLPTDGTLTVKVNELPTVGESVTILTGTVSGTCAGVISVDGKTYAATISQEDGVVVATRTQTVISNPEISVSDTCSSLSGFLGDNNILNTSAPGTLTLTFTANDQTFTFDNTEALTFTSITVAESAFTGCKVVFGNVAVTTAALTANTNVEVPLALINDANVTLTVPTGKTLTVNVATDATLNRAISFDGIFAKNGTGTLTLGANVAPVGGTIVAEGTLKFENGLIPYGSGSTYPTTSAGNVTVCTGATLDVNSKADAFLNMVTLQEGATFANSSGTGISDGSRQLKGLTLEGNATVRANANFGILAGGHVAATLTLNGHTLTKTGTANFWLSNTAVTNGTLVVEAGAFKSQHKQSDVTTFTNVTLAAGTAEGSSMVLTGKVAATITNEDGDIKVNGKIENGTDLVGSVSVTKGAAILSGENTYTGGSIINDGTTLKVATATATGTGAISGSGLLEACANITYSDSDPLEASTFNGTFKVGDGATVKLVARESNSADADVYGNIIVGEGATLNVNGRLAVANTTVTLCNGATLTSSATVGSGYSWISWPFVNLAENATATISGATFSSVYSGNNAHTWDLNGGTLKFDMNGATFKASTLNFTAGTVKVVSGTLEFAEKDVTEANANLNTNLVVSSDGKVAFNKKHYFASVGGTGTVTGTLVIPAGATLDASMGALTANAVTWNGAVVIQVPETVEDWTTGVEVLNTATTLPTNYVIKQGNATLSTVMLIAKSGDGIYAVKPIVPEISVGEGETSEEITVADSNITKIQEAAAAVGVTEVTSVVGALISGEGEPEQRVDLAGLELFEDVAVEVDAETKVATINYAFGIESISVQNRTVNGVSGQYIVLTATVEKGDGTPASYAADTDIEVSSDDFANLLSAEVISTTTGKITIAIPYSSTQDEEGKSKTRKFKVKAKKKN